MAKDRFVPTPDGFYALQAAARRHRAQVMGRMLIAAGHGVASLLARAFSNSSKGRFRHA